MALVERQKAWNRDLTANCGLPDHGKPTDAEIGKSLLCVRLGFLYRARVLGVIADIAQGRDKLRRWSIPPYEVFIDTRNDDLISVLSLYKDGHWIYSADATLVRVNPKEFFVETKDYDEGQQPYEVGRDVLGVGAPALLVSGYTGGAHCCFNLAILVLGTEFREMQRMDLRDDEIVKIRKPAGGIATMEIDDFNYDYWRGPFSESPAPKIVLSYDAKAGQYAADPTLMRTPLPDLAPLIERARAAQQEDETSPNLIPHDVSGPILDLIYGGHLAAAHEFLVDAWTGVAADRDEYWNELTNCRLRHSHFWPAIAALNGLPADKPAGSCS